MILIKTKTVEIFPENVHQSKTQSISCQTDNFTIKKSSFQAKMYVADQKYFSWQTKLQNSLYKMKYDFFS